MELRRLTELVLTIICFAGSFTARGADLSVSCESKSGLPTLALYVDRYPYSTIRLDQPPYLTTTGLELAWQDIHLEAEFASQYLSEHGVDTTASKLLRTAEDNAAIAVAETRYFSDLKPSVSQLRNLYSATSPTLAEPPFAQLDYYFLRRQPTQQTSEPLVRLISHIRGVRETSVPLFNRQLPDNLPDGITTGSSRIVHGKIDPAIETRAFQLPINSPTLFEGEHGWYILSVRHRRISSEFPSFEATTATLERMWYQNEREAVEADIRQQIAARFPANWTTTGPLQKLLQKPSLIIATVGSRKVVVSELLEFARIHGSAQHTGDLETALNDYLFRLGIIQLAGAEGLTSSCLYILIRDLGYRKALANIWLQEQIAEQVKLPAPAEVEQRFARERTNLKLPEHYAVMDVWTTAPTAADFPKPDRLYLARERTRTRMMALRDTATSSGFSLEKLPQLDKEYGPFIVQDYPLAPQGPRGYLLDTTVEQLKVGEFSSVVEDSGSFHFYLLKAKTPSRPMSLDEATAMLTRAIRSERIETARRQLLEKSLGKLNSDTPRDLTTLLDEARRERLIMTLLDDRGF